MRKALSIILVLILTISSPFSALSEDKPIKTDTTESKPVALFRYRAIDAWVPCNDQCVMSPGESGQLVCVSYYKLKGIGKNPTIKVSYSARSWLSAEIKSKRLYLKIKGANKTLETKEAIITVRDKKSVYATIMVHRCGSNQFTSIKQTGGIIKLKMQFAEAAWHDSTFIQLVIFDENGKAVRTDMVTYEKPVTGKTYVYNLSWLKDGYTYAFSIGYKWKGSSIYSNLSWAAAVRIKSHDGNRRGKVKFIKEYSHEFLYNLGQ